MKKNLFVVVGAVVVIGAVAAGAMYYAFPVQMTTYGGMGLNFLKTLSTPAGTLTVETNPAYKPPVAARPSPPLADAAWLDRMPFRPSRTRTNIPEDRTRRPFRSPCYFITISHQSATISSRLRHSGSRDQEHPERNGTLCHTRGRDLGVFVF